MERRLAQTIPRYSGQGILLQYIGWTPNQLQVVFPGLHSKVLCTCFAIFMFTCSMAAHNDISVNTTVLLGRGHHSKTLLLSSVILLIRELCRIQIYNANLIISQAAFDCLSCIMIRNFSLGLGKLPLNIEPNHN